METDAEATRPAHLQGATMIVMTRRALGLAAALALAFTAASAQDRGHWTGAWASAQQVPEPRNALPADALNDATLRQIVRLTLGGPRLKVRVSNAFGTTPLTVTAVRVARPLSPDGAAIDPATERAVTFAGQAAVTIPAGADYLSDPVDLPTRALSDLAVTMLVETAPAQQTSHPGSRATSYVLRGDHVAAAEAARLYPKNAHLAAAVALAGLGLDRTQVELVADPSITENIGRIDAEGAYASLSVVVGGKSAADNPKTSQITGMSVLAALDNRGSSIAVI